MKLIARDLGVNAANDADPTYYCCADRTCGSTPKCFWINLNHKMFSGLYANRTC